jgi:hypothetical protein
MTASGRQLPFGDWLLSADTSQLRFQSSRFSAPEKPTCPMTARLGHRFVFGAMSQERGERNVYGKAILKPFKRQIRPIFGMRCQGSDHKRLQREVGG